MKKPVKKKYLTGFFGCIMITKVIGNGTDPKANLTI